MKHNQKNIQQAKAAAQRIYRKVNFDGGNLQTYQISSLIQQTYEFLKIPFKPTTNDIKEYSKVLDSNGDGQVNLKDLQQMAVFYLCGQGVLSQSSGTNKKINDFQSSSYTSSSNNYSNVGTNQTNTFGSKQTSYRNSQMNNLTGYQNTLNSGYNATNSQYSAINSKDNQMLYTFKGNLPVQQTSQHIGSKASNQPKYEQSYLQKSSSNQLKTKYTQNAFKYLNITRTLFKKYANYQNNRITKDKVSVLLTQTYGALGRKGYYPSEEDVNVWMKLCDTNNDGEVEEAQYQYFVVRALERSGIQVYNQ